MAPARLSRRFYARPTLAVAEALLGRLLVHEAENGATGGRIVEVEAYVGPDDPASHAVAGRTARNASMWGEPGCAYVYFTYGMHHCLNVVTERVGFPAAVLIRALEPTVGIDRLRERRPGLADRHLLSGPGRVCAGLGLGREHDGVDLVGGRLWIGRGRSLRAAIARGPRVGIRHGLDRPWRLFLSGHPCVSGPSGSDRVRRAKSSVRPEPSARDQRLTSS
ncbi:MAG TPA: DNA-3-methyladenine glycosylase [Candidatus Eisenbacteria bacterium]|nr:DNA-3-methyladenine glycosylase [Candidatus Eisenbacteria bacterium]